MMNKIFFLFFLLPFTLVGQQPTPVYHSVNVITGNYVESEVDLEVAGSSLTLQRFFDGEWKFNLPSVQFGRDELPEESESLTYEFDEKHRLIKISEHNLHWIAFSYPDEKTCIAKTSDDQSITYTFQEQKLSRDPQQQLIESVSPHITYHYAPHPVQRCEQIEMRELPDGRYLKVIYHERKSSEEHDRNYQLGKVKELREPAGPGGQEVTTYKFTYRQRETEVIDASGNKTLYQYGDFNRFTAILEYKENELYRVERFYWDDAAHLISRTIEDGNGWVHLCCTYHYDRMGNLRESTTWGDLSGSRPFMIDCKSNGIPNDNGVERYSVYYDYDHEGRLIYEHEESGKQTWYEWNRDGDKVISQFTGECDKIQIRDFFHYDDLGQLVEHIQDDPNETQKKRTVYTYEKGLPVGIEEWISFQGEEKCTKSKRIDYGPAGKVLSEKIFGPNDWNQTTSYQYDEQNRLIWQKDADGKITETEYDAVGNSIVVKTGEKRIIRTYDCMDRLIREQVLEADQIDTASCLYDKAGYCVGRRDTFDNLTEIEVDSFGRKIKEVFPAVLDENDQAVHYSLEYEYDLFGREISITDSRGYTTRKSYNIRGDLTSVHFSDGTFEQYEYHLGGSLYKKRDRDGITHIYQYDYQNREISEEILDQNGISQGKIEHFYNAFYRTQSVALDGSITHYEMNPIQCSLVLDGEKKMEVEYSPVGEIAQQKIWFGEDPSDYLQLVNDQVKKASGELCYEKKELKKAALSVLTSTSVNSLGQHIKVETMVREDGSQIITSYDALDRPSEIQWKDAFGKELRKCIRRYDSCGNKIREVYEADKKTWETVWKYGPESHLEAIIEGWGTADQRCTVYQYDGYGRLETFCKPDGIQVFHDYDAMGRLTKMSASDGSVHDEYQYDLRGNIVEVRDRFGNITTRVYEGEQLVCEQLQNGLTLQYSYDLAGRRTVVVLPDDSEIQYRYEGAFLAEIERGYIYRYKEMDHEGKPIHSELIGDLGEIHYTYNDEGHLISIEAPGWTENMEREPITGRIEKSSSNQDPTTYQYDSWNQLRKENEISYEYDPMGNRRGKNEEVYTVDALHQLLVAGERLYHHDSNGNRIVEFRDDGLWHLAYDALDRLIEVTQENLKIEYSYDSFHRRMSKTTLQLDPLTYCWNETETIRYLWEGENEIGVVDSSGKIIELRVLGLGLGAELGAAVMLELDGKSYAPLHDHRGNLTALLDPESGEMVFESTYSAFGEQEIMLNQVTSPWGFSSKRSDSETGLLYFGKRYLDPVVGRWLTRDPLGYVDGPNPYQFVRNNPINQIDPNGLMTFKEWMGFARHTMNWLYQQTSNAYHVLKNNFSYLDYIRPHAQQVGEKVFGQGWLLLWGFYQDKSETGIYGKGEMGDKVRITMVNGILNARGTYKQSLIMLSEAHGGCNVHYIFNATQGWSFDLFHCVLVKFGYITPSSYLIAEGWKKMISEMGGVNSGGVIVHYAHSIGGTDTYLAKELMSEEELKMIHVITIGSATMITEGGFASVMNYVSLRDGICYMDPIGYLSGLLSWQKNIVFIGSLSEGFPFVDHLLTGHNYSIIIAFLGEQFLDQYVH